MLPVVFLTACQATPVEGDVSANAQEAVAEEAVLPKISAPLTRRDILIAAAAAASDHVAGVRDDERDRALNGRPFSFRIRYCPTDRPNPIFRVSVDVSSGVFRAAAKPDINLSVPGISSLVPARIEAVEGFWIPRPWLLDAACPAPAQTPEIISDDDPSAPPAKSPLLKPTVGIAEFFDNQSTRTLRRQGRAYEATQKTEPGVDGKPLDLVLEGRIKDVDGTPILCAASGADTPPTCVVSVQVDRIRLELAGGALLGEWSGP